MRLLLMCELSYTYNNNDNCEGCHYRHKCESGQREAPIDPHGHDEGDDKDRKLLDGETDFV